MYALGHGKFETLKHNSTSANLIPVGITYTNHKGMHAYKLISKSNSHFDGTQKLNFIK